MQIALALNSYIFLMKGKYFNEKMQTAGRIFRTADLLGVRILTPRNMDTILQ